MSWEIDMWYVMDHGASYLIYINFILSIEKWWIQFVDGLCNWVVDKCTVKIIVKKVLQVAGREYNVSTVAPRNTGEGPWKAHIAWISNGFLPVFQLFEKSPLFSIRPLKHFSRGESIAFCNGALPCRKHGVQTTLNKWTIHKKTKLNPRKQQLKRKPSQAERKPSQAKRKQSQAKPMFWNLASSALAFPWCTLTVSLLIAQ